MAVLRYKEMDSNSDMLTSTVEIDGESYYKIQDIDQMPPFFVTVVSNSNHWMFLSTKGSLTAGRQNRDRAIFPYKTDDKIHESVENSGPKTIVKVARGQEVHFWEPFSVRSEGLYNIQRNFYKNSLGNKVVFEEYNRNLGLTFSYSWSSSRSYGFVRSCSLINSSKEDLHLELLDGFQNILPSNIIAEVQNDKSNLVDAYKRNELTKDKNLAIYTLNAVIVDRAEPSESLTANSVFNICSSTKSSVFISSDCVSNFRSGKLTEQHEETRAQRGAYFMRIEYSLLAESDLQWKQVLDQGKTVSELMDLEDKLADTNQLWKDISRDIELGSIELKSLVAQADGLQVSSDKLSNVRHFANVMFNIMRGGIFDNNYAVNPDDFAEYLKLSNRKTFETFEKNRATLPTNLSYQNLSAWAYESKDLNLSRLAVEYLPLKFSRRHGDPSRPWNKFSINTIDKLSGKKLLDYQGNWRDIFQNWEALAYSYPEFLKGMIFKFLNNSTVDGYNPYRISKTGFDWEIVEPDDPWAFIGYWGDHQIIYLLKFLEFLRDQNPSAFVKLFNQREYVFAQVPYKIKSYSEILKNPKDTIVFDKELDSIVRDRRRKEGSDGALFQNGEENIQYATFEEKILITLLAKLSNFIPETGIWLNTQRPEWNDANNALVGNGVSMVTLYYIRRFLEFFENQDYNGISDLELSEEVYMHFEAVISVFSSYQNLLSGPFEDSSRKEMMDELGKAASEYRNKIYSRGFGGKRVKLEISKFRESLKLFIDHCEHCIESNRRKDQLFHSYNLINYDQTIASVKHLDIMLEGQVAVLSSGYLNLKDSVRLLDSLKASALYRKDQSSYTLYPDRQIRSFLNRNTIETQLLSQSVLLQKLVDFNHKEIVERDKRGGYHFGSNLKNASFLKQYIDNLSADWGSVIEEDNGKIFEVYESVFQHKFFTGRSGTFFGYEGLGSIYWHMVSKLVLAISECILRFESSEDIESLQKLKLYFQEVKYGIGVHKNPREYGAIPTDPYSHTPAHKGAQQPGMTGQVKEDVLTRWMELGVSVKSGLLSFRPSDLLSAELLSQRTIWTYFALSGKWVDLELPKDSMAFTYCQIPIIYKQSNKDELRVSKSDGSQQISKGFELDKALSEEIFNRSGNIDQIEVYFISKI